MPRLIEPILTVTDTIDAGAREIINAGLRHFNVAKSGIDDWLALDVLASDPETHQVVGGLTGRTSLGLLFIDVFFLPESMRGGGVGSRILRLAEEEATRRGCSAAVLYTISFQAPGFYERNGYRTFGKVGSHLAGVSRVFMMKSLAELNEPTEQYAGERPPMVGG